MQVISFDRSIDQLEDALVSLSKERNATEYRFLGARTRVRVREGYRLWALNNTAEWLNMRCGISLGAAREKVRVAMALFDKPQWSAAFREGELSYSKARAMTRVPNPDEAELLAFALEQTTARVESCCRELRNADRKVSTGDANRAHAARWVSCSQDADGMVHLTADLPAETGMLVMKALEIAARELEKERAEAPDTGEERDGYFARQADALVEMARSYLADESAGKRSDSYQVMLHVDESALRGEGGRSDLPVETMRRIACGAGIVPVVMDEDGNPLNVGRKQRMLSPAGRRALYARDKQCVFPGCSHTKWLEPHHVVRWADGGETSAENHMLLCSHHHRLLHEGGYTIHADFEGNWYFKTRHNKILTEKLRSDDDKRDTADASRDAYDGVEESASVYQTLPKSRLRFAGLARIQVLVHQARVVGAVAVAAEHEVHPPAESGVRDEAFSRARRFRAAGVIRQRFSGGR
ncbi:MAG: DUF222 domain-containing protein [Gammaproteobacteria bacterium]|nr:DUF222 domain-containing protein [Gammaproteobacteria bacterium]